MECLIYNIARISLLSKLKYIGMKMEDLLTVYKTYIRCNVEYCCVVWHSSLTVHQNNSLERVQRVCLKIILGKDSVGYISALESCELETLESRRGKLSSSLLQQRNVLNLLNIVIWTSTTPPGAVPC